MKHLGASRDNPHAPLMLQQECTESHFSRGILEVWEHFWAHPTALPVEMLQPSHWDQMRVRLVSAWWEGLWGGWFA